jgi:hypothetical protein
VRNGAEAPSDVRLRSFFMGPVFGLLPKLTMPSSVWLQLIPMKLCKSDVRPTVGIKACYEGPT